MLHLQVVFTTVGSLCRSFLFTFVLVTAISFFLLVSLHYQSVTPGQQSIFRAESDENEWILGPKPTCSFTAFQRIAKHYDRGYLPGHGTWRRNSTGQPYRFVPSICHLEHGVKIPSKEVSACLRRENLRHIVVMGDSNGRKYYLGLYERLRQLTGFLCTDISGHFCVNWTTYEHMYIYHRCQCDTAGSGRCAVCFKKFHKHDTLGFSLQAKCRVNDDLSVVIEFSPIRRLKDGYSIKFNQSGCQPSANEPIIPTNCTTNQEFMFREFHSDPRPDLIVLFSNAHDSMLLSELSTGIHSMTAFLL